MLNNKELIRKGKRLAWLLRHDEKAFKDGIISKKGWRLVSELIREQGYSYELLNAIVETNDKKRYEFNNDKSCIRARQGHSIPVDVELTDAIPPDILYHGTSTRFFDSIFKHGLVKGNRLYVHLSSDSETALKVGKRHGSPYVFRVDALKMYQDGLKFYKSNNGVWLTDSVPAEYLLG